MRIVIVIQDNTITDIIHTGKDALEILVKNGNDLYHCTKELDYDEKFVEEQFKAFLDKNCTVEGTLDNICCHRVSYYFKGEEKISEEIADLLDEHAEQVASEKIKEGHRSGELYFMDQLENEYSGWWRIV